MGRKKANRKTVMIRAYEDFSAKLKQVSAERGLTAAEFCDQFFTIIIDESHRKYIEGESEKLAAGSPCHRGGARKRVGSLTAIEGRCLLCRCR